MVKNYLSIIVCLSCVLVLQGQYWQQSVKYEMDINVDAQENKMAGTQIAIYTNNSPDELNQLFYHLYFNAFQPGSMMDMKSLGIQDPDKRVGSRISQLKEDEIGYHHVLSLTQDGEPCSYTVAGTILEVELNHPISAGASSKLEMTFESQIPVQIRRNGRDNAEGIRYSMSQWYPKICEYDRRGWHANPYVGREFHGVWGDFKVSITIDESYVVAATGHLTKSQLSFDSQKENSPRRKSERIKKKKRRNSPIRSKTWVYEAENIHDFVWAADPDYKEIVKTTKDGIDVHYFYQPSEKTTENWENLPKIMDEAFDYINSKYGQYPYKKYAFIQGGDGGMEYPMATLITGERSIGSLVGVSVHELMHSWYQMILGTNESLYAWIDEGFTSYATSDVMNHLRKKGLIPGEPVNDPHLNSVMSYVGFSQSGMEEPLSTHADHFLTNAAYGVGSYVKGAVFLSQLRYVVGEETLHRALRRFFDEWKFKHPEDIDFVRIVEKESGLELDWYREYMVNTIHTIDYAISNVSFDKGMTQIELQKQGVMPMPVDVLVTTRDGAKKWYHIPLRIMRGEKKEWSEGFPLEIMPDWPWTNTIYSLNIPVSSKSLLSIEIDPNLLTADTDRSNNNYTQAE